MPQVELRAKVQVITYEYADGFLGKEYATSEKRISLQEAAEILNDREIEYKEIMKVKYEYITLKMSTESIGQYIQN